MTKPVAPAAAAGKNLHWLLRYARRSQLKLDAGEPPANAIKSCFTPPAWRLLCRSGRNRFIPILRNRRLVFDSLVHYTQRLVEHGFQVAPNPVFLAYFIESSYLFFDRMPGVPDKPDEMVLLRLATRCGGVSRAQLRRVHEWLTWGLGSVTVHMTWRAVLRRADDWHRRQQAVVEQARANHASAEVPNGWDFACGPLNWDGYAVIPLVNDIDLWDEGQAMSSCLYKIRRFCNKSREPSRFFSVRRNGLRCATLELVGSLANPSKSGLEKLDQRWRLQDCRLAYNRLPPEALVSRLADFASYYNDQACARRVE